MEGAGSVLCGRFASIGTRTGRLADRDYSFPMYPNTISMYLYLCNQCQPRRCLKIILHNTYLINTCGAILVTAPHREYWISVRAHPLEVQSN